MKKVWFVILLFSLLSLTGCQQADVGKINSDGSGQVWLIMTSMTPKQCVPILDYQGFSAKCYYIKDETTYVNVEWSSFDVVPAFKGRRKNSDGTITLNFGVQQIDNMKIPGKIINTTGVIDSKNASIVKFNNSNRDAIVTYRPINYLQIIGCAIVFVLVTLIIIFWQPIKVVCMY